MAKKIAEPQHDTLANATKNEARLKLLGPTYGIVCIQGNEIVEATDFEDRGIAVLGQSDFLHIRLREGVDREDSAAVTASGEYMNSFLVTDTVAKADSATTAAKRLVSMLRPGISDADAMNVVLGVNGVSAAIEGVLALTFK